MTDSSPAPLKAETAQDFSETYWHELHVGNVCITADAVLAPGRHPFAVRKLTKSMDAINNHFFISSGHINERLLRETAQQHGVTLPGVLQPCSGCLEAIEVRTGVPRRTASRAEKPMETVHVDLAGPYDVSVGGSVHLIMFVDSTSRWMRPNGMIKRPEIITYVRKLVTNMNGMRRPYCFRTDNGGEFTSSHYVEICDSVGIRREYTAPGKPQLITVVQSAIW